MSKAHNSKKVPQCLEISVSVNQTLLAFAITSNAPFAQKGVCI